ncbi:hypothetical protein POV27_15855 [Aureisphaera galaxeae]|uniref:hypothetical protein n=1 Tax=Aureisphaera galaxeae TaxID=1538023 RepID=UPI00234FC9FD|nr:hypothetical protein [Aureisphaera galaxeae]MDC8005533.1 hypothetical protein [Aureisphaera galaxeae]
MKILRFVLMLGGLALVAWGIVDYVDDDPENSQALAKILLGASAFVMAFLAKSRR